MFRLILNELLVTTPGALAALFLDYEGETVELVCDRDISDHDLRIVGAYQRIHFSRLEGICERIGAGAQRRMKLQFPQLSILSTELKDGYYVVLLVDESASEGIAWRRLDRCRDRLLEEM